MDKENACIFGGIYLQQYGSLYCHFKLTLLNIGFYMKVLLNVCLHPLLY